MNQSPDPTGKERPMDLLTGLLSDPQALDRISAIIRDATEPASNENTPQQEEKSAQRSDLPVHDPDSTRAVSASAMPSDGLAAILSDPAMLEKLPQMIAVMKPLLGALSVPPQKTGSVPPSDPTACRNNLLLALKPFLSPHRRDAIDTILRISQLGNVFSQLK